jgi:hypothetical protein
VSTRAARVVTWARVLERSRAHVSLSLTEYPLVVRVSASSRFAPPPMSIKFCARAVPAWVVFGWGRLVVRPCFQLASRFCVSPSSRARARATPGSLTPVARRQAVNSRATQALSASPQL